jgi:GNAT superfamily N-acetyltransferase
MNQPVRIEQMANRTELLPVVAAWIYDEWWQYIANHIPLTLVASLDTLPVGTATLLAHDVGTEQWSHLSPWIAAVYVVPEYRRRGIGASLVNAIVSEAAAAGTDVLYLLTTEREGFYVQLGW